MLNKVSSLGRAAGIVLAVIAGFVALGGLNVALVLVVLGLIAGLSTGADRVVLTGVMVLVLPVVGAALKNIPEIGDRLVVVTANVALVGAGALATAIALVLYHRVMGDVKSLTAK